LQKNNITKKNLKNEKKKNYIRPNETKIRMFLKNIDLENEKEN
jgi:hypothetical protein